MPPKTRAQQSSTMETDGGQKTADDSTKTNVLQTTEVSASGGEAALTALANMFQTFLQYQKQRDERQEKDVERREQQFKVLTHQVTQLQMDVEHARHGSAPTDRSATWGPAFGFQLPKLQDEDNIENYLITFERLAQVYGWPKDDWAVHLIRLLKGKSRTAFVAMSPATMTDYDCLREVIIQKYEISTEMYRLKLRALDTPIEESPVELYVRFKDLFCKWVCFDSTTKAVDLEQYMRVLYPEIRTWVKERNPATAAEAAKLVEDYIAARKVSSGMFRYVGSLQSSKGKSGGLGGRAYFKSQILKPSHVEPIPPVVACQPAVMLCVTTPKSASLCYLPIPLTSMTSKEPTVSVLLNGKPVTALLDTGCAQTLVKEQSDFPTAKVYIEVNKQPYLMKVGIAATLPFLIVLGTDSQF
ncbi:Zinc finger protein 446 [Labeo rohita]|uniref:Zinc finger protein 446 n=1 Tax=Labeo rohita TaxID=84645 RepID=A0ABQ8LDW1_LABRO|nr:Zinc finger protein 446 [Labeo rohita]